MTINNIITKKGLALPIGNDYYLMKGKNPNKTDDIDIDIKQKNGIAKLSVDHGEVVKTDKNNNEVLVFSAQKFLGGESPANLILKGANPNLVFAAQEQYKQINGINDDGSKKKAKFGIKEFVKKLFSGNSNKSPLGVNDDNFYNHAEKLAKYQSSKFNITEEEALYNILNSKDYDYKGYFKEFGNLEPDSNGHFTDKYKTVYHDTFSNESVYSGKKSQYNPEEKIGGSWDNNGNFIKNKKQYGGMNKTQYNIRILGYNPSTGKQYQSNNRKRALWGTDGKWYENEENMPENVKPAYYSKVPERPSLPMFTVPKITMQTVANNKQQNNNDISPEEAMRRTGFRYFLANGIAQGANLLSGLYFNTANAFTNKAALNKMEKLVNNIKSYDIPLVNLKTRFNINPQLSEVERKLGLTTRDIDANTVSSQVALARKRNARYNASAEKNKLYAQKENIETNLINQNILQQAQTMAKNIQNRQNIDLYKNAALRDLIDKHSESQSSMWQNYSGIFNSAADSIGNMFNTWLKYKAGMNASPNGIVGANA